MRSSTGARSRARSTGSGSSRATRTRATRSATSLWGSRPRTATDRRQPDRRDVLQHVTLELRRDDWPAAKQFWSMVGFEEVEPPGTLGERSAWVERNGTQIPPQWEDDPVIPPEAPPAVVVDDWDGVVARLRDQGYEVDERPRHWGAARCFVRAPGGHRVE